MILIQVVERARVYGASCMAPHVSWENWRAVAAADVAKCVRRARLLALLLEQHFFLLTLLFFNRSISTFLSVSIGGYARAVRLHAKFWGTY